MMDTLNGGHPFRTAGIPRPDPEVELEDLPKYLFVASCKCKGKDYGSDYYTVLANTYDEVLKFLIKELKYEEENISEIKRQSTLISGTSAIAYKR